MKRELQRLNMNMPADLIEQVDNYAKRMNLNRTSAMILLVSTGLEQEANMSIIHELLQRLFAELDEKAKAI